MEEVNLVLVFCSHTALESRKLFSRYHVTHCWSVFLWPIGIVNYSVESCQHYSAFSFFLSSSKAILILARKPMTESWMKAECIVNIPPSKIKDHLTEGEMRVAQLTLQTVIILHRTSLCQRNEVRKRCSLDSATATTVCQVVLDDHSDIYA